jgi:uncharacterized protein YjbJ (UPF0337 family)
MDKNRIAGTGRQAKGAAKEAFGKITGNTKMKMAGKAEKNAGKAQRAMGRAADKSREAAKKSH